jgi:CBS domain-containing protein
MPNLAKITVADYMSKRLISLSPDTDVLDAINKLLISQVPNAPVLDNTGNLVGMFSEKDAMKVVLEASYNQNLGGKVKEFMNKEVAPMDASTSVVEAASKLHKASVRSFPVYDSTDLVGIISRSDVLRALVSIR